MANPLNEFSILPDESTNRTLPGYGVPGFIEFEILHTDPIQGPGYKYEIEVLKADLSSSVYWIQEGVGFDGFIDDHVDLELPGKYRIEGITGKYYRGYNQYGEDDYEEWDFERILRIE